MVRIRFQCPLIPNRSGEILNYWLSQERAITPLKLGADEIGQTGSGVRRYMAWWPTVAAAGRSPPLIIHVSPLWSFW
jgi:hypothetical protein